jgi:uncharacterized protein YbjT (DUF2867 family)
MSRFRIAVLGGTGFVGHSLCAHLAEAGHDVQVLTRHRERHRDLLVLPTAQVIEVDVYDPAALKSAFRAKDAVVNLVGILNETGRDGAGFERAHAELPARVTQACRQAGVPRLLHMSALHASVDAPSHYLRSKARGEQIVHAAHGADLHVTSFRPSVIFGRRDSFTNRFAGLLQQIPFVFPLACPDSRMQPVYVEDVTRAFVQALGRHATFGQRYDLCGPRAYTLREIVTYLAMVLGLKRRILPLGNGLSRLQAALLQFVPGKPFTPDNYRSLQVASICEGPFPPVFGLEPRHLEEIVPTYLGQPAF